MQYVFKARDVSDKAKLSRVVNGSIMHCFTKIHLSGSRLSSGKDERIHQHQTAIATDMTSYSFCVSNKHTYREKTGKYRICDNDNGFLHCRTHSPSYSSVFKYVQLGISLKGGFVKVKIFPGS